MTRERRLDGAVREAMRLIRGDGPVTEDRADEAWRILRAALATESAETPKPLVHFAAALDRDGCNLADQFTGSKDLVACPSCLSWMGSPSSPAAARASRKDETTGGEKCPRPHHLLMPGEKCPDCGTGRSPPSGEVG